MSRWRRWAGICKITWLTTDTISEHEKYLAYKTQHKNVSSSKVAINSFGFLHVTKFILGYDEWQKWTLDVHRTLSDYTEVSVIHRAVLVCTHDWAYCVRYYQLVQWVGSCAISTHSKRHCPKTAVRIGGFPDTILGEIGSCYWCQPFLCMWP